MRPGPNPHPVLGLVLDWNPGAQLEAMGVQTPPGLKDCGLRKFQSHLGLDGLFREVAGALEIVAIATTKPGKGRFRKFIAKAKKAYPAIVLWEVWNPWLPEVLTRYGFQPVKRTETDAEVITGYRWTA